MERATKSGFALEAQQKIYGKYDASIAAGLLSWIADTTGLGFDTDGQLENFVRVLKDGTVLCTLANTLKPGAIKKINQTSMAFKQMENISFFLNFVQEYVPKNELFQTVDLYEGQDPNTVVVCLSSLARKCDKLFGKAGVGPKEAESEKRTWSEEQLKAGDSIIGLQMGSNKGANASGINMGNTRHI